METTIHHQLKELYAEDASQTEVALGPYRMDAIRGDELVEIQWSSLAAIRDKCEQLLRRHRLRVVKPIVERTRIIRVDDFKGKRESLDEAKVRSRRMSPKRGSLFDVFEDLVHFTRVFPHSNLTLELPLVRIEQFRVPHSKRRRRAWHKDYRVVDVRLESIESTFELHHASDLWALVDCASGRQGAKHADGCASADETASRNCPSSPSETFNTADMAKSLGCSRHQAQQIAYVMRKTGVVRWEGRNRSGNVYRRAA